MFEKLLELLAQSWHLFAPFGVVDVYEGAGVLRFGCYNRTKAPGFYWKWPLAERAVEVNTCLTTLRLPPQTLTTKDGHVIVVAAIIKYQIDRVEPYISKIWDQNDVLADVTMGAIRKAVSETEFDALRETPPEDTIIKLVRAEVNQYGFKIHKITFTDLGKVMSVRLIQAAGKDIAN